MTNAEIRLSPETLARVRAEAEMQGLDAEELLDLLVTRALDRGDLTWMDGAGDHLVAAASSRDVIGVYFPAETAEDGDGYADDEAQAKDRAEIEQVLRDAGIERNVQVRDFAVGRGAQGVAFTLLSFIGALGAAIAAPAVVINQWSTAAPKIREWLRARNGMVTLALVIQWCLEDAAKRVDDASDILPSLAAGHRGVAFTTAMDDELVGPFCVTIQVPARTATFVYVADEVGEILHFVEVPGPSEEVILAEENR
jgi:hypothetical protein